MIKLAFTSNVVCNKIFNEYAVKTKPTEEIVIQFLLVYISVHKVNTLKRP